MSQNGAPLGKTTVGGGGGGGIVIAPPAPQTLSTLDISGLVGNTVANWHSFTFVVSSGTILIDGETFGVGTYSGGNGSGTMLPTSYDAGLSVNAKLLIQI